MILQNLNWESTQQVILGNSSETGTREMGPLFRWDRSECRWQQWLVWSTDRGVLGTLRDPGRSSSCQELTLGHRQLWEDGKTAGNRVQIQRKKCRSVIFHDNLGNAVHRVQLFSLQGIQLWNDFPKTIKQQKCLITSKNSCRIVISSYRWHSVQIILLLHYYHTRLELQGNNHHPKFFFQSELWSQRQRNSGNILKDFAIAVSLGKDHGQEPMQLVQRFKSVFSKNRTLPLNR